MAFMLKVRSIALDKVPEELREHFKPVNDLMTATQELWRQQPRRYLAEVIIPTGAVVANSFPLVVNIPFKVNVRGVNVSRLRNETDPSAAHTSAVWVHYEQRDTGSITVKNITGLSANTVYHLTLEVLGD